MVRPLRLAVVAGEASGDALAAPVIDALARRCPGLLVEGIGGAQMQARGLHSLFPMERLSVMGVTEPLTRLPELLRIRRRLLRHFLARPPDLFLGVDAPDFNLPLARRLRLRGVPTAQLVSPSIWAWRPRRVHGIGRAVDRVLCLFPFEPALYDAHGISARFVGHPLARDLPPDPDKLAARDSLGLPPQGVHLALLPGSRPGEVRALAPRMLAAARRVAADVPALHCALPLAGEDCRRALQPLLADAGDLPLTVFSGRSREVMAAADAVLTASGTATLEAALLRRPQVVAYRMGALSWLLLSQLVRTRYVALPNILAGRALVPELLQDAASVDALADAVRELLCGDNAAMLEGFAHLRTALGTDFGAHCADVLLELVSMGGAGARPV